MSIYFRIGLVIYAVLVAAFVISIAVGAARLSRKQRQAAAKE